MSLVYFSSFLVLRGLSLERALQVLVSHCTNSFTLEKVLQDAYSSTGIAARVYFTLAASAAFSSAAAAALRHWQAPPQCSYLQLTLILRTNTRAPEPVSIISQSVFAN